MKRFPVLLSLLVLGALVLTSCAQPTPTTEKVVVTVEVEKQVIVTQEVEKVVEVEKIVTQEVEKIVTQEVEKIVEVTPQAVDYGLVTIFSTQANPIEEQEKMRGVVLKDFSGTAEFVGVEEPILLDRIAAESGTAAGSIDLVISLHGAFPTMIDQGAMMDLSDLVPMAQEAGIPEAFMELGKMGTDQQYYIPMMQATYIFAANKKALDYLPQGVDVNDLTWEQVRDWAKNIEDATGEKKLGFPASDRGLMHRFLEGYIVPSYTGGMVTNFKSAEAVEMWNFVIDMWQYVNPQATTYAFMQEQLLSEEVWLAFDHTARLIEAFKAKPDDFLALPSPRGPAGLGFMPVIVGMGIPKNAPNPDGAKEMIRYILQDSAQINILREIGFFPVADVDFPGFVSVGVRMEGEAVTAQAASPYALPSLLPVGLGDRGNEINKIFRDTFTQIVLQGQDIQTVLSEEGAKLQALLDDKAAKCWPPDPVSTGTCQVK